MHFNAGKTIANGKPSWAKRAQPGDQIGRLTVLREAEASYWSRFRKRRVVCLCACGKETVVCVSNLYDGHTQSCGCLLTERLRDRGTHGETRTRLYRTWRNMLARCRNPRNTAYRYYGAMGVTVCEEWQHGFVAFRDWAVAHGYAEHLTIDRIDPWGNYEPRNCRWATYLEQRHNQRKYVSKP
jgi:hypothetical protein